MPKNTSGSNQERVKCFEEMFKRLAFKRPEIDEEELLSVCIYYFNPYNVPNAKRLKCFEKTLARLARKRPVRDKEELINACIIDYNPYNSADVERSKRDEERCACGALANLDEDEALANFDEEFLGYPYDSDDPDIIHGVIVSDSESDDDV